jgi:hypothetical protein
LLLLLWGLIRFLRRQLNIVGRWLIARIVAHDGLSHLLCIFLFGRPIVTGLLL